MLKVDGLATAYGEIPVLSEISFETENEIFAVLGANGAGKTTLLKALAKLLPATQGHIAWQGEDVTSLPAYDLAPRGVAYVPQEGNVFPRLSVAENLSLGALMGHRSKEEKLAEVFELFPRLAERQAQAAGSLSGGEGQMLAVGRALMQDPTLILLDEPSAGLSPLFVDILFEKIVEAREAKGLSIVLAEQNAVKTLEIANRVLVLSLGKIHSVREASSLTVKELMQAYHI
ncbi:MAG: ATP-binding cassette domain-containing protein [Pseudomonadota bacterium]